MPDYHVGTSGWHYDHWRGLFYPGELARAKWLGFYARSFKTVELNNSFYHLPTERAFTRWRDSSPEGFVFSVKVSRFITHIKKLKAGVEPLENFLSRAGLLREKLGPLLYQLPPGMKRNDDTLEAFLAILPPQRRHVFEFRHESWLNEAVFAILRRHGAGLCVFDMPGLTCPVVATADFAYIRFHGSSGLYSSRYSDQEISDWVERIAGLGRGLRAVYIYFNNDARAYAVDNAKMLEQMLKSY